MVEVDDGREVIINAIEAERWTWIAAKDIADQHGAEKSMAIIDSLLDTMVELVPIEPAE